MKNTTNLLYAFLFLILSSCDFSYSKSWSTKTLADKDQAKLELEIESNGYFSTKTSGSADGEFLFQRLGNLKDVVESFTTDKEVVIEGISNDYTYNLKVTNYPAAKVSELSNDILDFMADKADFQWKIKEVTGNSYSIQVSNESLLIEAKDNQPGVKQLSEVRSENIKFVGTLSNFISFLNEEIIEEPIKGDIPELEFNLSFELPNGNIEDLITKLKNAYGITLTKEIGKRETIVITPK